MLLSDSEWSVEGVSDFVAVEEEDLVISCVSEIVSVTLSVRLSDGVFWSV